MTTCTGFIEPLNLKCLLINTFAGGPLIFIFLAYLFISTLAAFFRMNGFVLALVMIVFTVFLQVEGTLSGLSGIGLIMMILIPLAVYSIISKLVKN